MIGPAEKSNLSFSPFLDRLRQVRSAPAPQQKMSQQSPAPARDLPITVLRDLGAVDGGEEDLGVLMQKSGVPLMEFVDAVRQMQDADLIQIVRLPEGERVRLTNTGSALVDIL